MELASAFLTHVSERNPVTVQCKVYWVHTRLWDQSWISAYHAAASGLAREIAARKVDMSNVGSEPIDGSKTRGTDANQFTCEDFAFEILVEFASRNKLPLKITTGSAVFKNVDPDYKSGDKSGPPTPAGFALDLAIASGAHDVVRNSTPISDNDIKTGDLFLEFDASHVQVVTAASPTRVEIMQGNFPGVTANIQRGISKILGGGHIRYTSSGNRESPLYMGVPVGTAVYEKRNGAWLYQRQYGTYHEWDSGVWDNTMNRRVRWNFLQFNY